MTPQEEEALDRLIDLMTSDEAAQEIGHSSSAYYEYQNDCETIKNLFLSWMDQKPITEDVLKEMGYTQGTPWKLEGLLCHIKGVAKVWVYGGMPVYPPPRTVGELRQLHYRFSITEND